MDFIVLDELGYLPFAQSGGQLLFHLVSQFYERASILVTAGGKFERGLTPAWMSPICRASASTGMRLSPIAGSRRVASSPVDLPVHHFQARDGVELARWSR